MDATMEPTFSVGTTYESTTWRIHRYNDSIALWSLRNAGKRGKKVTQWAILPSYKHDTPFESLCFELKLWADRGATEERMAHVLDQMESSLQIRLDKRLERGIDVLPANTQTIRVETKNLRAEFSPLEFSLRHVKDVENETTTLSKSRRGLKELYTWVVANRAIVETMTYAEMRDRILSMGISIHEYCAMD